MKKYLGYLPSGICIVYYLLVCVMTSRLGGAQLVWLAGAAYLALYTRLRHREHGGKLEVRIMTILLVVGLACAGIVEGVILSAMVKEPSAEAEYVIVLGAKVNGTTPSWSLRARIDSAAEYLLEHPTTMAVASGGQGADEGISEGLANAQALENKGIDPQRILIEDKSTSTEENLIFSEAVIESHGGSRDSNVVVVTSDFHMFRTMRLAERLGYTEISGKTAKTLWLLVPQNHVREILAIGYYFVTGSL
ncbi:MAG: YdcF family protein [Firmicutes bacterium]|nr:YdcF family protein [Bacillota bacterium]